MKIDGEVMVTLSFEEFAAIYRLLWKTKPEMMRNYEMLEPEVQKVLKVRIGMADWKNKMGLDQT